MKFLKSFVLVAVAFTTMLFYGCENVSDPIDISSTAKPSYVELQDTSSTVLEGDTLDVVFELPVAIGENVDVTFSISGTATYGTDWKTDNSDVSADGGTVTIEYVDSTTSNDEYALEVIFPKDGEKDGEKTLTVTLESAVSESGEELMVGQGPNEKVQNISIQDFDQVIEIQTGTYNFDLASESLGTNSGTMEITELADPVVSGGTEYPYQISDAGGGLFSSAAPHAFSVVGTGVVIAPQQYQSFIIESGSYNEETGQITMTINYQSGTYYWTITLTPQ